MIVESVWVSSETIGQVAGHFFSNIFLVTNYIQNSNYIRKPAYLWHFVSNLLWIDSRYIHPVCDEYMITFVN